MPLWLVQDEGRTRLGRQRHHSCHSWLLCSPRHCSLAGAPCLSPTVCWVLWEHRPLPPPPQGHPRSGLCRLCPSQ